MKSEAELTAMILTEIRKRPECVEVDRVLLIRSVLAVNGANWDIAVGRNAQGMSRESWNAERVIARSLQKQYDLSD